MRFCLSAKCDEEREELELLKINNDKLKDKLEEYFAEKLRYKEAAEVNLKANEEIENHIRKLEDNLREVTLENQRLNKAFHQSTEAFNRLQRGEAKQRRSKKKSSSVHRLDQSEAPLNPMDMFSMFVTGLNKKPR
jgi:chromosome segregation ATPase